MQSAILKSKTPTVINLLTVTLMTLALLLVWSIFTPIANAASSKMLVDAPACVMDCPYGLEAIFKKRDIVWMVCYKDMRWRWTNGQYSNRWFRVISDRYPNELRYTPAPAVGSQAKVSVCR